MRQLGMLVLILVAGPAAWAQAAVDDDAGTGADAPPLAALAPLVGPGTHAGALTGGVDVADAFAFEPPPTGVVRVAIAAQSPLVFLLLDAEGRTRDRLVASTGGLSAVSLPAGRWALAVQAPAATPPGDRIAYAFTLAHEARGRVLELTLDHAPLAVLRAAFPLGHYARFDAEVLAVQDASDRPEAAAHVKHLRATAPGQSPYRSDEVAKGLGGDAALASVSGAVPAGVRLEAPATGARVEEGSVHPLVAEDPAGVGLNVTFAVAERHGVRARAWLAWDGPAFDAAFVGGSARFASVGDFEPRADGLVLVAGRYAVVENASLPRAAPPGLTTVLYVDARPSPAPLRPAEVRLLRDGVPQSWPTDVLLLGSGSDNSGAWVLDARHLSGVESGRLRLIALDVPEPPLV